MTVDETVVRKSVRVQIPVERAFSMFVEKMETWWPATHQIGGAPFVRIVVEPRVGGRWYERDASGVERDWGTVLVWEPPQRVTLSWHLGPDYRIDEDLTHSSEVEIRFKPDGPCAALVELEHSKIERHGEGYERLRAEMDQPGAWAQVLADFARGADGEGRR